MFFTQPWNLVVYAVTACFLAVDALFATHLSLYITIPVLLTWDLAYVLHPKTFHDNEPVFILERGLETMRQIAYFIPIYALLLGALFSLDAGANAFHIALTEAGISYVVLVTPLILASVGLILIPVKIKKIDTNTSEAATSNSMKSMLFVVMFAQQASIVLFVHISLAITLAFTKIRACV